jgi:hypothetical protein
MALWMFDQKTRVLLTLTMFDSWELLWVLVNYFVHVKKFENKYSFANFVRKTPSLRKTMLLLNNVEEFRETCWSDVSLTTNPQRLYLDLKEEPTDFLLQRLAKKIVLKDARYATYFDVATEKELERAPNIQVLREMEKHEAEAAAFVNLQLTVRGVCNTILNGRYRGAKYFGCVSKTPTISYTSYGPLICKFLAPHFDYGALASVGKQVLPPPLYALKSSCCPKQPLRLCFPKEKKEKKPKRAKVSA